MGFIGSIILVVFLLGLANHVGKALRKGEKEREQLLNKIEKLEKRETEFQS